MFQFNKHTPATSRHNKIHEFQHGKASGAYVFVVTVQTAAVGITLTAATRVYLMEPLSDPAAEVQAAGRIHRLGQSKDIFITRYAFRDSIEEATAALHERIKQGEIVVRDGQFPHGGVRSLRALRAGGGFFQQHGEARAKVVHGEGLIDWEGRSIRRGRRRRGRRWCRGRRRGRAAAHRGGVRDVRRAPADAALVDLDGQDGLRLPQRQRRQGLRGRRPAAARRGAARSRRCRSRPTSGCPSASAASRRSRG